MMQATTSQRSLVMGNPKLLALHDEKILQFFSRSVKLTELPMLGVIVAITLILHVDLDNNLIWLWVVQALLVQIPRLYLAGLIADPTKATLEQRKMYANLLALIGGVSIGSVVFFASQMTIETKALLSICMVGLSAGSLTTCHGYKPIYLSFVAPIFIAMALLWFASGNDEVRVIYQVVVIFLTVQLATAFYGLVGRVHATFCEGLVSQHKSELALNAEKLANSAKTRFLAAASHDLRQPLHTMALFSAALAMRPLDETSKSIANKMNEAMKALADELDSLLDISKLDAGVVPVERANMDLSSLVSRVASLFKLRADQKNIELHINVEKSLFVHSDAKLIERLLRNILDNAVKYTHKGRVTCGLSHQNGIALITILDTGPGIDSVEHEHIWEEFYQVDNASRNRQQGLGLGLSVVSRLATLLDIRVNSVPQLAEGACFEIAIPTVFQGSAVGIMEDVDTDILDTQFLTNRHVLVVDDDEGIQQGTESLLKGMGMKVSVANGTATAIELFKNEAIDVILMDLRLADGDDGFDTIKKLKAIDDQVSVIVMSGDTAPDRLKNAESIGCTWLIKPMKLDLLVAEFDRIFK